MKCLVYLATGFEECEALITVDLLRRADIEVDMVSISDSLEVSSSHQIVVKANRLLKDVNVKDYDVLILPGGKVGTANLEASMEVKNAVQNHFEEGKLTCAICAAPSILGHLGILENRKYTCFPSFDGNYGGSYQEVLAVSDGNLITGRGMGATIEFAREILKKLVSEQVLENVENGIQYAYLARMMK